MKKTTLLIIILLSVSGISAQDSTLVYKKQVLEKTEVDFLSSYYSQDGENAAVSGGIGTEELTDIVPNIIVSMPLNDDDILTVDMGISAYTSASSSNVDPFDSKETANPFQASSGASASDLWVNLTSTYSHASNDRNTLWSGKLSISSEYDYFSLGVGGSITKLFNQKNTELSLNGNVYLDTWNALYPSELRPFQDNQQGLENAFFNPYTITGNANYNPQFTAFNDEKRNSYALGFSFSQIINKNLQGGLLFDLVQQQGLLSTPFQRVYFSDVADSYIEEFQLADDIERLPDNRIKIAIGGRLNYYLNETFILRTYYRYYFDDWGISSQTASLEIPIKISNKFTLYPSYRYYNQTAADYFAPYERHLSTNAFYTSDYDLSEYVANQFGFGVSYTDIFTKFHIWKLGLKKIDLKYSNYQRDSGLTADNLALGFNFIMD